MPKKANVFHSIKPLLKSEAIYKKIFDNIDVFHLIL